eukprot:SAG31_NODE_5716_length_2365_cov_1.864960_3_plen_163_part_01
MCGPHATAPCKISDDMRNAPSGSRAQYVFQTYRSKFEVWIEEAESDDNVSVGTSSDLVANQWVHVALTRSADRTIKVFLNGNIEANERSEAFNIAPLNHIITIGCRTTGDFQYRDFFAGMMNELRLFNAPVGEAVVADLYAQSVNGLAAEVGSTGTCDIGQSG